MKTLRLNSQWKYAIVMAVGCFALWGYSASSQRSVRSNLSPNSNASVVMLEAKMVSLDHGDLLLKNDGTFYFVTRHLKLSEESEATRCIGCSTITIVPNKASLMISKIIQVEDADYQGALTQFATQTR